MATVGENIQVSRKVNVRPRYAENRDITVVPGRDTLLWVRLMLVLNETGPRSLLESI